MAQLPTQSQFGDYSDWPGRDVLDSGGQRLGSVREIYLDRESGRPEWVLVDVIDSEARFVPLANADIESWLIRVAHDAEKIRSAPGIGAEPRIDQSEERRLYAHYGLGYSEIDRGPETPPAPAGWGGGGDDRPSGQARDGEAGDTPTASDTAASSHDASEPTNLAPPPAEPPSPAELESAQIPDEPPAASDRASEYETAPFGAVAPPSESPDDLPAGTFASTGDEDPPAGTFATTGTPPDELGTPDAAKPDLDPPALAAPIEGPSTLTPPAISHGAESPTPPPVTADTPVADDTPKPTWASSPPPSPPEPAQAGALERAKRSPGKMAAAGVAAAVLFFIVRRLR